MICGPNDSHVETSHHSTPMCVALSEQCDDGHEDYESFADTHGIGAVVSLGAATPRGARSEVLLIDAVDAEGKRVFVRVDFGAPQDEEEERRVREKDEEEAQAARLAALLCRGAPPLTPPCPRAPAAVSQLHLLFQVLTFTLSLSLICFFIMSIVH